MTKWHQRGLNYKTITKVIANDKKYILKLKKRNTYTKMTK